MAGGGEAGERGESSAAAVVAEEEPVLASEGKGLHGPFGGVVIDGEIAIGHVDIECRPLITGVRHGFTERTFRQHIDGDAGEPVFQRRQPRDGLLLPERGAGRGVEVLRLVLDGVELLDACDRFVGLAGIRLLGLDKLPPGVGPAADFDDRSLRGAEEFVVAGVGVTREIPPGSS